MANKVIRQASKCANSVVEKSRFFWKNSNKKVGWDKIEKKNAENINPKFSKTSNGETMLSSKCPACGSKKSKFMK